MIARNEIVEIRRECPVVQLRGLRARVLGNLSANDTHKEPGVLLEVVANRGRTIKHVPLYGNFGRMRYAKNELVGFRFRLNESQVILTN